ncbi:MAG: polysaccharide biosynthesis C-terminal domain-containing protein [Actinomadura sp.]
MRRRDATVSGRARQVVHTLATYAATRVLLGGLIGVIISRVLGPEGRGDYALVLAIATIAGAVGRLSIEHAHVSLWSTVPDRAAIAANSLLLGPALGILAALAILAAPAALGPEVLPVPSLGVLAVALATVPCTTTGLYLTGVLLLRGQVQWVNWSALLGAAFHCGSLAALAAAGRLSVAWAVALWAVGTMLPLAVLVPAVRPGLGAGDLPLARRALGMGLRYHTGVLALFLLFRVDVLILGALRPAADVGLYALAVALAELTRVAADSVAQVTMAGQLDGDRDAAAACTFQALRVAALLSLGSVAVLCAVAPLLIPLIFGSAFSPSVAPLLALAPGMWALGMARPVSAFLLRLDRPVLMSSMSLAALAVNVGLNLALIPRFGVVGCAVAASAGYGGLAVLQVGWLLRATRMPPRRLLVSR